MSWTQSDLDKINKAIASGARRVKYQDQEVEYRSLAEMKEARDMIEKSFSPQSSCSDAPRSFTYITGNGL